MDEFKRKYIPKVVRNAREAEFMALIKGHKNVAEYEAEFAGLVQYAPYILHDEERKTQKFIDGLKPDLRWALATWDLEEYTRAVDKALKLKAE